MWVRIRKATEQSYWYADQIGEEFEVIEIHNDRQNGDWTVNDGEYNKIISKLFPNEIVNLFNSVIVRR